VKVSLLIYNYLSIPKHLKSPKFSKRRPTIFVGKGPNPWGGEVQTECSKENSKDPSVQQSHQQGEN
jgi:hypothetical protein